MDDELVERLMEGDFTQGPAIRIFFTGMPETTISHT